jgi:hypothetical protein
MQVKQNFERFISCKTTIDDIYVKLQHIESTSTGISTEILYSAIQQVRRVVVWLSWCAGTVENSRELDKAVMLILYNVLQQARSAVLRLPHQMQCVARFSL